MDTSGLVRTDDSWRELNFLQLVEELRKWTERNPIRTKSNEKLLRDKSYQTQQKDERGRECVYCEKPDHRSVDCKTVTTLDERKRLLSNKRLCFNFSCARFARKGVTLLSAIGLETS